MNNVMFVGRIGFIGDIFEIDDDKISLDLTVNVNDDNIPITVYGSIASNTKEYCKVGDIIAIKGSLKSMSGTNNLYVSVAKVSFLSSKTTREVE